MKKGILILAVLCSLCILSIKSYSGTPISSGSVSGTWTPAGSPYNIEGNIQILKDSTLTILPGVTVNFQGPGTYKLSVQGRLLAIGTSTDTIIFTATNPTTGWLGIRFDNTPISNDTSKIVYCKLQYGKATGSSPYDCGGAFYFNNFSKVIISHSSILNCSATNNGGGIYCIYSNPIISNNFISNNQAPEQGGGIYCDSGEPIITHNTISNNTANCCAGSSGGGIYCSGLSPSITFNTISNNISSSGGGIYCNGSPSISNNIISNNISSDGGGIYSNGSSSTITNNTIFNNSASYDGGGGILCNGGNLTIKNNSICNNTASNGGGVLFTGSINPSLTLSNNVICNNTASTGGGGIYCETSSIPTIINSTIANNSAVNGGGLYCEQGSNPNFRNCILWGNTASVSGAQVFLYDEASNPNFYYCDVQGGKAAFDLNGNSYTGSYQNNINADPKFVAPSVGSGTGYNGITADWSLQNSSTCIDAGDNTIANYPATDIAGNPRVNVCRIDIGAYEYQTGIPSFVVSLNISQPIICNGAATGEITAVVSGGTTPYTYLWNKGQNTDIITGLVAGTYTLTVSTPSYGCTLTKSITLTQPLATSVYAGTDTTIICGSFAQLSAKAKWVTLNNTNSTSLYSVYFTDVNTGYAIGGYPGVILKTTDGGQTWIQLSESGDSFYSIRFLNADTGYVVGDMGTIIKTTDGGLNWITQPLGTWINPLYSVYFTNSDTGYTVGGSEIIFKTTDGGTNWVKQTPGSGSSITLYSVFFLNADKGYAVGSSGTILKTTNGGTNWTQQTSGTSLELRSVYFIDSSTGYMIGGDMTLTHGTIFKTTDGGTNWTVQLSGLINDLYSIYFTNTDTGYAVGAAIMKTTNGGTNWIAQNSGTGYLLKSVYFPDANTGYAVGMHGTILKLSELVSYSWSPTNSLNNASISKPIATPNVTTSYIVTTTSENGCLAKDTVTVYVNPLTAFFAESYKTIICGGTAQLDKVTTNYTGTGTLTYKWSPAISLDYDTVPNPKATVTSDTKYYVTVTTPNGCSAIDSVIVYVNPLTASTGSYKTIICGGAAQLDVVSNYTGTGTLTYNWSPAISLDYDTVPNPKATVTSDTKYYVTVTTPNGCTAASNVTVNVNPLTASAGGGKSIVCGEIAQLDSVTSNYTGTGTLTYKWSPAAGLNNDTIPNPKATVTSNTQYYVTVTTPNGCVANDQATVTLNPLPAEQICYVEFDTATSKNNINWSTNLSGKIDIVHIYRQESTTVWNLIGTVPSSQSNYIDMNSNPFNQSYSYKISVKDTCGNETDSSASHTTITLLKALNSGEYDFTWSLYKGLTIENYYLYAIKANGEDSLIGTVPGNQNYYNYTSPNPAFVKFFVGFNTAPCTEKSNHLVRSNYVQGTTGVNELGIENGELRIYPNPANDVVTIEFRGYTGKELRIENGELRIYSIMGELMKTQVIQSTLTQVNISDLAKGVYIIKVTNDSGVAVKKIIKE